MKKQISADSLYLQIINNSVLRTSFVATVVSCMIAHGYTYFNSTFFHDRMTQFSEPLVETASMGKWFVKYVCQLLNYSYLPWLDGVLTIIIISLSVFLISITLKIEKKINIWLISGLCATSSAVIGAHFYWTYSIVLALLFSCVSVFFWSRDGMGCLWRIITASLFSMLSLATYGSYASVGPSLVILILIISVFMGAKGKNIIWRGLEYVISFLAALALFYGILRASLLFHDVTLSSYMGEDKLVNGVSGAELFRYIGIAYVRAIQWFTGFEEGYRHLPTWCAMALFFMGMMLLGILLYRNYKKMKSEHSIPVLLFLILIFPLSVGMIYVMAFNNVHYLMDFSFVVFYFSFICFSEKVYIRGERRHVIGNVISVATLVFVAFFVLRGFLISNMAYARANQISDETEHIALRLIDRIESCDGFTGGEAVIFAGDLHDSQYYSSYHNEEKEWLDALYGLGIANKYYTNGYTYDGNMYTYLKNVMNFNLPMMEYDENAYSVEENAMIQDMSSFPADDAVMKIGETIVVKLSE